MLTRYAREDREPVTDHRLAALLDAAAAPAEPGPVSGEEAAVAAFRSSAVRADGRRPGMHLPTTPLKSFALGAASAGLLLTGGVAAANAGVLPGAAQDTAQTMLDTIGVDVPGASEQSAGQADTRGQSEEAPPAGDAEGGDSESASMHGKAVSELAKGTELEGAEKGKAISEAAKSNGQAHQHGPAQAPEQSSASESLAQAPEAGTAAEGRQGGQSGDKPPVATPNDGGTDTADQASASGDDEAAPSTNGTDKAESASGGRSTAGSGNRP
jgi:hypothetical protein